MLVKESDQAIEFLKTKGLEAIKGLLKSDTLSKAVRSSLNNVLGVVSNQPSTAIELITSFSLQYFFDLILNESSDAEIKKVQPTTCFISWSLFLTIELVGGMKRLESPFSLEQRLHFKQSWKN